MPPTTTTTSTAAAAAAAVFFRRRLPFFRSSPRESRVCKHPRKVPLSRAFVLPRAGNDITAAKEGPFVQYLYKAAHHWQAASRSHSGKMGHCVSHCGVAAAKSIVTSVAAGRRSRRLSVQLAAPCWRFPSFRRTQRETENIILQSLILK